MDLPDLSPPNLELEIASSQLSIEQAFLLLDWIRLLRTKGFNIPERFKEGIQNGKWMKTYTGYKSPRKAVLPNEMGREMFVLMKHILKDISVIDQEFYSNKMSMYQETDHCPICLSCFFWNENRAGLFFADIHWFLEAKECDRRGMALKKGKWLKTHQGYNAPEGSVLLLSKIEAAFCLTTTDLLVVDEAHYGSQLGSFLPELKLLGVIIDFVESLKLIAEKASFPPHLPFVTSDFGLLMLKCIKCSGPNATRLIERVRGQPWLKTTFGFKSSSEITFPNSRWDSLARALQIPTIDELYYGDELSYYLSDVSATGVAVDRANIIEMIAAEFKSLSLSFKLGPDIVLSMLDCFKEMRRASSSRCSELQWLHTEKQLKTRHGYKAPTESIIFSMKWAAVSCFVDLPIIDDVFYSIVIYKYKDELQIMGIITDFEGGAGLVLEGLKSPIEPEIVTANGTMALLKCLKSALSEHRDQSAPESFLKNISKNKCLKTATGYLVPGECVLFSSAWGKILKQTDVASIDITETSLIKRLYNFLSQFNCKPEKLEESNSQVWIPNLVGDGGKWVNTDFCIIRDKNDLFGSRLYSVSQFYKPELLHDYFLPLLESENFLQWMNISGYGMIGC
ncbi:hypothetical protein PanWU01x14_115940 [Parasponia andersonii]|uniref:Uncharacterized protein n=1 Tax=Parasponia andersonii TaxID=3476 RepID=A0A2P5CWZ3_PARAD|nr:hypothetical protein PanWU01x14_115940 [Parasponia andersonii]